MTGSPARTLRWPAYASGGVIALLLFTAIVVPQFLSGDPLALSDDILQPPSTAHLLGTDDLGRDVLVEIIYGTRVSVRIPIGLASAWEPRSAAWLDSSSVRLTRY